LNTVEKVVMSKLKGIWLEEMLKTRIFDC